METKFKETKIGRIPEEWDVVRLDSVCIGKAEYGAGESAMKYENGLIRYVRITDINADGTLNNDAVGIPPEEASKYILKEGDYLFARSGSVGLSYLYDARDGLCAFAGYLIRFRPRREQLLPTFLKHYCHSAIYWKWIHATARATTQSNINATEYSGLPIALPPLPEQRKIAEILSEVDGTIEKTDAIIQETQRLKKGLMQKLLTEGIGHTQFKETKIGRIPEEWEVVRFSQCLQKTKQKDPTKKPAEKFTYIDVSAVSNELFKIVESKTILGKDAPSRARKGIKTGDTIYATVRPYLRRVAFVPSELDGEICSTGYCVLRPKSEEIFHRFVFQLMLTHRVNEYLESLQAGTSYPAISDSDVYQMLIPKPPLPEQRRIAEILSEVDAKIEKEQDFKSELKQLKKGLMQVLLTGKVRVKV